MIHALTLSLGSCVNMLFVLESEWMSSCVYLFVPRGKYTALYRAAQYSVWTARGCRYRCIICCVWALHTSCPSPGRPARRHLSQTLVTPPLCGATPHGCSWSRGQWTLEALPGPFSLSWAHASVWCPCESEPKCCWDHRLLWQEAGTAGRPSSGGNCLSSGRLAPHPWANSLRTGKEANDVLWFAVLTW